MDANEPKPIPRETFATEEQLDQAQGLQKEFNAAILDAVNNGVIHPNVPIFHHMEDPYETHTPYDEKKWLTSGGQSLTLADIKRYFGPGDGGGLEFEIGDESYGVNARGDQLYEVARRYGPKLENGKRTFIETLTFAITRHKILYSDYDRSNYASRKIKDEQNNHAALDNGTRMLAELRGKLGVQPPSAGK